MGDSLSWVVGRGGMLGRALERVLVARGRGIWCPELPFSWGDRSPLRGQMDVACREFARAAAGRDRWAVAWCAGAGVVASDERQFRVEIAALLDFLQSLARSRIAMDRGALFLASSAGGVYAGSPSAPPYDELSPCAPLSPYGRSKLRQEKIVTRWATRNRVPTLIGRMSNLYGPGQNVSKSQGLISHICLAVIKRKPLALYVPIDTIRDYLFVDDAARMIAEGIHRLGSGGGAVLPDPPAILKVLASGEPVTIGTILSHIRLMVKRPISIVFAEAPHGRWQLRDLRMSSSVWKELDEFTKTHLGVGIRIVMDDLAFQYRSGAMGLAR